MEFFLFFRPIAFKSIKKGADLFGLAPSPLRTEILALTNYLTAYRNICDRQRCFGLSI